MSATVELVKERLPIQEVIGAYVELKPAGSSLRARCPFHQEKTPSFFVSPTRGTFYCFGCGAKGDIFTFVEKFEGLDFAGALRLLAERAGVPVEFERPEKKEERDQLFDILEAAATYYETTLKETPAVQEYLIKRGLSESIRTRFRVGYSLPTWRGLLDYLTARGFAFADIEKAGLAKRAQERYYDRFRGRIMFPITDRAGRVVAFSGRFFEAVPGQKLEEGEEAAKYINSPETPLYQKSRILYGYDKAKESIRRADCAMVVEGQMDLLMAHQAGYTNTVAVSGTALTAEHLAQIERLTKRLILCFDADEAGSQAALRSASLALGNGFDVKVVAIEGGKDPADLVKEDPELLKARVRAAAHIIDYLLERLSKKGYDSRTFRQQAGTTIVPFIARIGNNIDRAHFIEKVARVLRVPERAVEEDVRKVRVPETAPTKAAMPVRDERLPIKHSERMLERILGYVLWQEAVPSPVLDVEAVRTRFLGYSGADSVRAREELAFEAESSVGSTDAETIRGALEELFVSLDENLLREEFDEATSLLAAAEASGREGETAELLIRCHALAERLKQYHPLVARN